MEPEAPFVIEHREALIYMLCQAAELEHYQRSIGSGLCGCFIAQPAAVWTSST